MKTRLDNVGNVILDFKRFQQERQPQLANQVTTPPETFQEGQLVYLLAPSVAILSQKCTADFVGLLGLDPIHYIIHDIKRQNSAWSIPHQQIEESPCEDT